MSEAKIKQIINNFKVTEDVARLCVDELGNVDLDKLAIAIKSTGKDSKKASSEVALLKEKEIKEKIEDYRKSYLDAKERKDAPAMFVLKNRIHQLGGTV